MSIKARFHIDRGAFSLDVDLTIPNRGVTAIFGPSGCGKTTLLRAIAGLETNHRGYLRIGDEVWQDEHRFLAPHKRHLGYVFQEPSLFDHLSVRGNLEYGLKRRPEGAEKISLDRAVTLLGIGDLLDRRPCRLSGGEQQRVAIARALAVSPAILLLDEPLAALDMKRRQEIMPYLESLPRELDIPLLYVSHSRDEVARLADHLILLADGRVQAAGPLGDLFSRPDLDLAHGPEAETVIKTTIAAHDDEFALSLLDFPGGRFTVARHHRPVGASVRLRIKARAVSLTLERQTGTSILNIFPATVDRMRPEGETRNIVRLMIGPVPILAKITRKSAVDLEISPGKKVYAQIKSVALLS